MIPPPIGETNALSYNAEAAAGGWTTDFETYEEEQEYAARFNKQLVEEGAVLLKNKNGALPLTTSERDITLFGSNSYKPFYGGTGSAGMTGDVKTTDLVESLEKSGFRLNRKVRNIYDNVAGRYVAQLHSSGNIRVEIPTNLLDAAKSSYAQYGDAAIVTISRLGGEGYDVYHTMKTMTWGNIKAYEDENAHLLQLTDNERTLIKHMGENFDKVIVLINSGHTLEIGELEDDPNVDAVLYIGQPGASGFKAVPEILKGSVNPSGKTVDVYAANFKADPTWANFGSNLQHDPGEYDRDNLDPDYTNKVFNSAGEEIDASVVEYEEGIYVGYRWYETAAADGVLKTLDTFDAEKAGDFEDEYYNRSNGVVYPFGYGLSYTTFKQELLTTGTELEAAINAASGIDAKVEVKVRVTNTGDVSGKEVAQVYVHAPYTAGGIEKSEVVLAGFGKTKLLKPDESEVLTLSVRLGDIASFDYDDANKNGYKGWEIEAGSYEFRLQSDSHNVIEKIDCALNAKTTTLDNDGDRTNNTPFSNGDDYDSLMINKDSGSAHMTIMTRADFKGTYPSIPLKADRTFGDDVTPFLVSAGKDAGTADDGSRYTSYWNSLNDRENDPWMWYADAIGENWTQAATTADRTDGLSAIQLADMIGIDYFDDETVVTEAEGHIFAGKTHKEAWEMFMNGLTYDEMKNIISDGRYQQSPGNDSIGLEWGEDADGPAQLQDGTWWACAVIVGSMWNEELSYKYGVMVGNESLFLDVPGWYGPSMNVHRSQFGGRNFEYLSSDGLHSGRMAAAMTLGAQSKGVNCYIKHVGINEQETDRYKLTTYVDEQTMREVYFRSYEYAVKEGQATGVMTAMTRIGSVGAQSNYMMMNVMIRGEWGFKGAANSDGSGWENGAANSDGSGWENGAANYSQRGGCDFPLGTYGGKNVVYGEWSAEKNAVLDDTLPDKPVDNIQWYAVRVSAMRMLWVAANTNYTAFKVNRSLFVDKEFAFYVNMSLNSAGLGMAIDEKYTEGSNVSYKVTGGRLPIGVGFNEVTGEFTDRAFEDGEFEVEVTMFVNGMSAKTAKAKLVVEPMLKLENTLVLKVGEKFTTDIEPIHYWISDSNGDCEYDSNKPYVSIELTVNGGVPCEDDNYELTYKTYSFDVDALTESSGYVWASESKKEQAKELNGEIYNNGATLSFTPTEAGSFLLNIACKSYYLSGTSIKSKSAKISQIPIIVLPSDSADGKTIVSINKTGTDGLTDTYTILFNDGSTYNFTIRNGAQGAAGEQGEQGLPGIRGPQGVQGEAGKDGVDGTDGKDGEDGITPSISVSDDGYWVINGTKTDVKAVGEDGKDGADGAKGDKGDKGDSGAAGMNGENGSGCGGSLSSGGTVAAIAVSGLAALIGLAAIKLSRKKKESK